MRWKNEALLLQVICMFVDASRPMLSLANKMVAQGAAAGTFPSGHG
jgi:hypothetical protein